MSEQHRGDPPPFPATDDELAARITRTLHARAAAQQPRLDDAAARLRAAAQAAEPAPVRALHRGGKILAAGLVTGTLAVAGAGAAAAANPYSNVARAVEGAAQAVGIEWSPMPPGYTRAQYEAFWGSYDVDDAAVLSELWGTEMIETKARAGQLLLDGEPLPVEPGVHSPGDVAAHEQEEALDAFWAAGYTGGDLRLLMALWEQDDVSEAKVHAGRLLLSGSELPVRPSGEASSATPAGRPDATSLPPAVPAPARPARPGEELGQGVDR
ncbi:hypothetical protein [Cellulomonas sp. KH9]|uniref:hypothetical protein n=1 Tax=Cellulomonas sp. KH9 TaxID=1855324 RepID=UPI0008EFC23F|nr:hypothetical protein [Cellulomonas sp. KH9]SFJ68324.1 hypothetical protein SAMN05216467_0481 [Cellulomonas sp. KH9]